jgi:uncharacterized protein (DUF983 family)
MSDLRDGLDRFDEMENDAAESVTVATQRAEAILGSCPDCGALWDVRVEDSCPTCGLSVEDLRAAADFLKRRGL